jgi:hypothetical protein
MAKIPKQWPRYQNNGQDTKTMAKIPKQWPRYQNNGQDIKTMAKISNFGIFKLFFILEIKSKYMYRIVL